MVRLFLLLLLFTIICTTTTTTALKIGSFNVQVFGRSKMKKDDVTNALVLILSRYDLVLVQEVRDISGTAVQDLLAQLNSQQKTAAVYKLHLSKRLGRTNSKEQLAWFYKTSTVQYVGDEQTLDPADVFERPPHLTFWDLSGADGTDPANTVGILGIHVDPDDAVAEIDALASIVDRVVQSGAAKAGVWVMGDLNADCSYVTKTEWKCIRDRECDSTVMRLYNPIKYGWLLGDTVDTTTTVGTDCAYDRFVVAKPLPLAISNPRVYDFGTDVQTLGVLTIDEIKAISDHYPIEFTWGADPVACVACVAVLPACEKNCGGTCVVTKTTCDKCSKAVCSTSSSSSRSGAGHSRWFVWVVVVVVVVVGLSR